MSFLAFSDGLIWGCNSIGAAADTRLIPPGFNQGTAVLDTLVDDTEGGILIWRPGTFRNLQAKHNANVGTTGTTVTYRLFVNTVSTSLSCTVTLTAAPSDSASNFVNQVSVKRGDLVEIKATKVAGIGAGGLKPQITAEFV